MISGKENEVSRRSEAVMCSIDRAVGFFAHSRTEHQKTQSTCVLGVGGTVCGSQHPNTVCASPDPNPNPAPYQVEVPAPEPPKRASAAAELPQAEVRTKRTCAGRKAAAK